jgi:hypothetical protein
MSNSSNMVDRDTVFADSASMTSAVSAVLWLWDSVGLEVGEVAVVTDGHPWSGLASLAATWYGALPVLYVSNTQAGVPPGVTLLRSMGSETEARDLVATVRRRPRVAAAELSGTAAMVDLLLEALPPQSRLMLAGRARERLTVDYYLNVHIKGIRVVSGILESDLASTRDPRRDARARRLLSRPDLTEACRTALRLQV